MSALLDLSDDVHWVFRNLRLLTIIIIELLGVFFKNSRPIHLNK